MSGEYLHDRSVAARKSGVQGRKNIGADLAEARAKAKERREAENQD